MNQQTACTRYQAGTKEIFDISIANYRPLAKNLPQAVLAPLPLFEDDFSACKSNRLQHDLPGRSLTHRDKETGHARRFIGKTIMAAFEQCFQVAESSEFMTATAPLATRSPR